MFHFEKVSSRGIFDSAVKRGYFDLYATIPHRGEEYTKHNIIDETNFLARASKLTIMIFN
jgi:hypothetical protein